MNDWMIGRIKRVKVKWMNKIIDKWKFMKVNECLWMLIVVNECELNGLLMLKVLFCFIMVVSVKILVN